MSFYTQILTDILTFIRTCVVTFSNHECCLKWKLPSSWFDSFELLFSAGACEDLNVFKLTFN